LKNASSLDTPDKETIEINKVTLVKKPHKYRKRSKVKKNLSMINATLNKSLGENKPSTNQLEALLYLQSKYDQEKRQNPLKSDISVVQFWKETYSKKAIVSKLSHHFSKDHSRKASFRKIKRFSFFRQRLLRREMDASHQVSLGH
jgi:hypothetical protein